MINFSSEIKHMKTKCDGLQQEQSRVEKLLHSISAELDRKLAVLKDLSKAEKEYVALKDFLQSITTIAGSKYTCHNLPRRSGKTTALIEAAANIVNSRNYQGEPVVLVSSTENRSHDILSIIQTNYPPQVSRNIYCLSLNTPHAKWLLKEYGTFNVLGDELGEGVLENFLGEDLVRCKTLISISSLG